MELTSAGDSRLRAPLEAVIGERSGACGAKSRVATLAADHDPLLLAAALEARARQIAAIEWLLDAGLLSSCLV
jgi:hypothetical protein